MTRTTNRPPGRKTWVRIRRRHLEQNCSRSGVNKKNKGRPGFELGASRSRGGTRRRNPGDEGVPAGDLCSIPGELDTSDTHIPTPEVPRRTSLVRNLRRPWAPREHSPEKEKRKKSAHPLLAQCPSLCVAAIGARYPAQTGQAGAGGTPTDVCICGDCLQSRRGA